MKTPSQLKVQAERVAHRAAVERLREVYRRLAEFEQKATPLSCQENKVNDSIKEQEVKK